MIGSRSPASGSAPAVRSAAKAGAAPSARREWRFCFRADGREMGMEKGNEMWYDAGERETQTGTDRGGTG